MESRKQIKVVGKKVLTVIKRYMTVKDFLVNEYSLPSSPKQFEIALEGVFRDKLTKIQQARKLPQKLESLMGIGKLDQYPLETLIEVTQIEENQKIDLAYRKTAVNQKEIQLEKLYLSDGNTFLISSDEINFADIFSGRRSYEYLIKEYISRYKNFEQSEDALYFLDGDNKWFLTINNAPVNFGKYSVGDTVGSYYPFIKSFLLLEPKFQTGFEQQNLSIEVLTDGIRFYPVDFNDADFAHIFPYWKDTFGGTTAKNWPQILEILEGNFFKNSIGALEKEKVTGTRLKKAINFSKKRSKKAEKTRRVFKGYGGHEIEVGNYIIFHVEVGDNTFYVVDSPDPNTALYVFKKHKYEYALAWASREKSFEEVLPHAHAHIYHTDEWEERLKKSLGI